MILVHRFGAVLGATLLALLLEGLICSADAQDTEPNEGKKGKALGTLTDRSEEFIEVKADGEEKARRYMPRWVGGTPAQGGGFDKTMVKTFNELKVGSRVEVQWVFEERFRALAVKVLAPPKDKDAK